MCDTPKARDGGELTGRSHPANDGFAHKQVMDIQRTRMLCAMVREVSERGAHNVTVAHVVARCGVSRRTFYEAFADREDCFLAAFDDGVARVARVAVAAYRAEHRWRDGVRAGLVASLSSLDGERDLARLLIVESLGFGRVALESRSRVVGALIEAVDGGRREAKSGSKATRLTAEGLVGAVLAVLHARILDEGCGGLVDLVNPLMGMIVLPYLGHLAANRELERAAPKAPIRSAPPESNPLRELEMRLTYRTVRALMAVAANPGSSNRMVADGAGIADQGQISKLLARLHGLGLIENGGRVRGEPNVWRLTEQGEEVYRAIEHR